jgi:hypothetical protein
MTRWFSVLAALCCACGGGTNGSAGARNATPAAADSDELQSCTRLYVMTSSCGYDWTGGDVPAFYKDGAQAVSPDQARAACVARTWYNGTSEVGGPPVPILSAATIAAFDAAQQRGGCSALAQELIESVGVVDHPFEPR